jgi:hypothetical protein
MRSRLPVITMVAACVWGGRAIAQQPAAAAAAPAPAAAAEPQQPKPGSLGGRVVVAPGVPATACQATIDSAQLRADCSKTGSFLFKQVPPGTYDVRITINNVGAATLSAGVGDGQATYLGDVQASVLASVTGRVTADNSSDLDVTVIGVPELGVYTQPTVTGGYLLNGVPPGTWNLTIFPPNQSPSVKQVQVAPGQPQRGVDFQIKAAPPPVTGTGTSR